MIDKCVDAVKVLDLLQDFFSHIRLLTYVAAVSLAYICIRHPAEVDPAEEKTVSCFKL